MVSRITRIRSLVVAISLILGLAVSVGSVVMPASAAIPECTKTTSACYPGEPSRQQPSWRSGTGSRSAARTHIRRVQRRREADNGRHGKVRHWHTFGGR
jgi:hypothetical protein